MDVFEKISYTILGILALLWLAAIVAGMVAALPFGLIGLAVLLAVGLLLIKVIKERLSNSEDNYYDKEVDK